MSKAVAHVLYGGLGGHFNVLKNLVEADTQKEYDVSVIFYGIEEVRPEYVAYCKSENISFTYVPKKKGIDIGFFKKLRKAMIDSKAGTLFLHSSYPIIAAKKAKKKSDHIKRIIVRETQANHLKTKVEKQFTKLGLQYADKVVLLSELYKSELQSSYSEFDPSKVALIPNGINVPASNPYVNPSKVQTIGMLSRVVDIKDHETLIKAMKKVDGIELKIAGDGENLTQLKALVNELGLNDHVSFLGMVNPMQVPEFLQGLDIYVHASFGETMSNSIMQAQAYGLPIIGTDVKGINNVLVNNQNGLLVQLQDVKSYEDAINQLSSNTELRQNLSDASFAYADKELRRSIMFNRYKEILS